MLVMIFEGALIGLSMYGQLPLVISRQPTFGHEGLELRGLLHVIVLRAICSVTHPLHMVDFAITMIQKVVNSCLWKYTHQTRQRLAVSHVVITRLT